jgi:hypothetical protein
VTSLADIGRDALVYGLPAVDLYGALHRFSLDPTSPDHRGPLNVLHHDLRPVTWARAEDQMATTSADTLNSYGWLDLRGGPVALQMPISDDSPRVSSQIVDLYGYIVGKTTPSAGHDHPGELMVIGPDHSDVPGGVHCPTQLCAVQIKMELTDSEGLEGAHRMQEAMAVRPLRDAELASLVPAPAPVDVRHQPSIEFLTVLNWMLYLMPVLPGEEAVRAELAAVGIGGVGLRAVLEEPAADLELLQGLIAGLESVRDRAHRADSSDELVGTRESLGTDYLTRAAGAYLGLLGVAPVG